MTAAMPMIHRSSTWPSWLPNEVGQQDQDRDPRARAAQLAGLPVPAPVLRPFVLDRVGVLADDGFLATRLVDPLSAHGPTFWQARTPNTARGSTARRSVDVGEDGRREISPARSPSSAPPARSAGRRSRSPGRTPTGCGSPRWPPGEGTSRRWPTRRSPSASGRSPSPAPPRPQDLQLAFYAAASSAAGPRASTPCPRSSPGRARPRSSPPARPTSSSTGSPARSASGRRCRR